MFDKIYITSEQKFFGPTILIDHLLIFLILTRETTNYSNNLLLENLRIIEENIASHCDDQSDRTLETDVLRLPRYQTCSCEEIHCSQRRRDASGRD